ncbi:hypothetical protein H5410_001375 [Solanum commersonii]|uniref:Uncharacterized protein n=1 Tax=Solanum commersonii TaxID=4109 RepID=A0A9J6AZD4_SOLCO|nr:hypothetical protein H5410_001375 [Solanum commersonii]
MLVYMGLEIVTNKITHAMKQGVRHYLLGEIEPDSNFTTEDYCLKSTVYIERLVDEVRQIFIPDADYTKGIQRSIDEIEPDSNFTAEDFCLKSFVYIEFFLKTQCVPIIVGEQSVLNRRVDTRVDEMVNAGLVDEVRQIFIPNVDYTKGIRRSIGEIDHYSNFTAEDFCLKSIVYIEFFLKTQCVPIIVGGSNSYIEKLVEDPAFMFNHKYDSSFIWIDLEHLVLNRRVDTRVDEMVNAEVVDEVRQFFIPDVDYTKGIQRSIGVPEMAKYLRKDKNIEGDDERKKMILQASNSSIKHNTQDRKEAVDEAWRNTVLQPCLDIVEKLLKNDDENISFDWLEDEVWQIFFPEAEYTKGIQRSIGVPEMAKYLREEKI